MYGNVLEQVESAKLLGVEIDSELSFTIHIDKLCKKLSQRIGVLNGIKACLPLTQRMAYYNAVIKPVMNYASVIWYLYSSKDNRKQGVTPPKESIQSHSAQALSMAAVSFKVVVLVLVLSRFNTVFPKERGSNVRESGPFSQDDLSNPQICSTRVGLEVCGLLDDSYGIKVTKRMSLNSRIRTQAFT